MVPPKLDQVEPFNLAIFTADIPPAVVKLPPTYTSVPDISIAYTIPLVPVPKADQVEPSHLAIFTADIPPAVVKLPPTYTFVPDTAIA